MVGHNMGAKTAMTLSCLYPDRVPGFVSLDTAPKKFDLNTKATRMTL